MNCSTSGFPVLHCLLEFAHTLSEVRKTCASSPIIQCILPSLQTEGTWHSYSFTHTPLLFLCNWARACVFSCYLFFFFFFAISIHVLLLGLIDWNSHNDRNLFYLFTKDPKDAKSILKQHLVYNCLKTIIEILLLSLFNWRGNWGSKRLSDLYKVI